MMRDVHASLITGASSGIGRALALRLAAPGRVLHLGGRDAGRLEETAEGCRGKGAEVVTRVMDVTDREGMAGWICGLGRLDLVIANAGVSAHSFSGMPETPEQVRRIFATNLEGAINTALPALGVMETQEIREGLRGTVACVASIAALIALPHAPSYCAAKAALDRWTVATAPQARAISIRMVSICPGYVTTPMTAKNRFPMPGLITADRAAALTLRGIMGGKTRVVFPFWLGWAASWGNVLRPEVIHYFTKRVPG